MRDKFVTGQSIDSWQDVFIIENCPANQRTIIVTNLNTGASGNVIQYKIVVYAHRGGITEYLVGTSAAGVDLIAAAVKRLHIAHSYAKIIVQIKTKSTGLHNTYRVDFSAIVDRRD